MSYRLFKKNIGKFIFPLSVFLFTPILGHSQSYNDNGFTVIKPSKDSKLIYVSSSSGNDKNTCLTEAAPCKTITAGVKKMRNGYPDHLYLKRGDTWRGERFINLQSGRSVAEPAVVSSYGKSGPRPKIENSANSINIYKGKMTNFHFIGLEFSAYKLDPSNPQFDGATTANINLLGGNENILFEDNIFSYTEIILQQWQNAAPKNITLRRNIWNGVYYNKSSLNRDKRPSNLYADGVDGLTIEENVFDHGGWHRSVTGAGANMYNHNIYVQHSTSGEKLLLKNNIITRGSSHGVQLRAGGLAVNNFFGRNAVSLLIGYNAEESPAFKGVRAHVIDNVVSEGHSMVKGDKPCSGTNLCTAAVWGIDFSMKGEADYQSRGNIVSRLSPEDTAWRSKYKSLVLGAHRATDTKRLNASNNIGWKWESEKQGTEIKYPAPDRTLADYNASLGGKKSFDDFMNVVLTRAPQTWDERYTAAAINNYIRAGFGK